MDLTPQTLTVKQLREYLSNFHEETPVVFDIPVEKATFVHGQVLGESYLNTRLPQEKAGGYVLGLGPFVGLCVIEVSTTGPDGVDVALLD